MAASNFIKVPKIPVQATKGIDSLNLEKWNKSVKASMGNTMVFNKLLSEKVLLQFSNMPNTIGRQNFSPALKFAGIKNMAANMPQSNLTVNKFILGGLTESLNSMAASKKVMESTINKIPKMTAYEFVHIDKNVFLATANLSGLIESTKGITEIVESLNNMSHTKFNADSSDFDTVFSKNETDESNLAADQQTVSEVSKAFKTGKIKKLTYDGILLFNFVLRAVVQFLLVEVMLATPVGQSVYQWSTIDFENYVDSVIEGNELNLKEPKHPYREVKVDNLALRSRPKHNSRIMSVLKKGTIVKIMQKKRNWKRVVFVQDDGSKIFGWTNTTYLKVIEIH